MKTAKNTRPTIQKRAKLKRDGIPRGPLWALLVDRINLFGLSRDAAAAIVDDAPSQLSRLMTGNVSEFSADRLALMLVRLACDIDIVVRQKTPRLGYGRDRVLRELRSGKLLGRVRVMRELRDGQRHEIIV